MLFLGSAIVFLLGKHLDKAPVIVDNTTSEYRDVYNYLIDFETLDFVSLQPNITSERALSGSYSGFVKGYSNYSPAAVVPIPSNDSTEITGVNVGFWLSPSSTSINAALVFSVLDQNNNQVFWDYAAIEGNNLSNGNWYNYNERFILPGKFVNSDFTAKIYLWNKDKSNTVVFVDDLSVNFNESNIAVKPRTKLIDFENNSENKISSKYAKSGFYSSFAKGKDDFSSNVIIPLSDLNVANLNSISYSFNYLSETANLDAVFTVSICDKNDNELVWNGVELSDAEFSPKIWETANGSLVIPRELLDKGDYIRLRLLNRNDNIVYVDDIYVVVKEKSLTSDSIQPAHNMMKNPVFEPQVNQPPYDFINLIKLDVVPDSDFPLNNIFTKNAKVLIGNFSSATNHQQLLTVKSDASYLLSFDKHNFKSEKVTFNPAIPKNSFLFADKSRVFVFDPAVGNIRIYFYSDKSEFVSKYNITTNKLKAVENIVSVDGKDFSVIEENGIITTFTLTNEKYNQYVTSKPFSPENNNLKTFIAPFFAKNKYELLCIYLENTNCKYVFLEYNSTSKTWDLSSKHSNKLLPSVDKIDFMSDYFLVDYNNDGLSELLQFSRNKKFSLKLISFDLMTYEILYNVNFVGFPKKQDPKYYEVTRFISANLVGDDCSEVVIFQDNINKVDWLTQKTEIYSFSN